MRVRHGKGDKERVASIADVTNVTKRALESLRAVQGGAYEYVLPSMSTGRDPEFASDKPMSASGVVRMLKIAVERSGVGHISAHDLRRTHITLALDNGAPLQDMQATPMPLPRYAMRRRQMRKHGANGSRSNSFRDLKAC